MQADILAEAHTQRPDAQGYISETPLSGGMEANCSVPICSQARC